MTFVLHQQAQVEANLASASRKVDLMGEAILGLTRLVDRVDRQAEEVFGRVAALVASMGSIRDGLNALTGIVGRVDERADRREQLANRREQRADVRGERLDRRLDRLEKAQERTDQQIKGLGAYFKRHLRKNNGRRPS